MDEFRAAVRDALSEMLEAAEEMIQIGKEITAAPCIEPLAETVRQLARTVSNSMRSVVILVENGCGTDTLKLARTIFETAVNIHHLHEQPTEIDDYIDFQWIKKKKHYEYLQRIGPGQVKQVDGAALAELNSEYARVSPRFMGRNKKVRNRWHKPPHREIAAKVGGGVIYDGIYPLTSSLTHMDVLGLNAAIGQCSEVEAVPSATNVELGLQIAVLSYAMALSATSEVLKSDCATRLQGAFDKFRRSSAVQGKLALWSAMGCKS